ncbi:MAG TPA: hypothetical protein VEB21_07845 [Terriglobales bacterium]|nr:hypothetical protein [Terriglobales bacterium]
MVNGIRSQAQDLAIEIGENLDRIAGHPQERRLIGAAMKVRAGDVGPI